MRTISAGGSHGLILLGKSEAGGGSIVSTQIPINSYVNLQGDFISRRVKNLAPPAILDVSVLFTLLLIFS